MTRDEAGPRRAGLPDRVGFNRFVWDYRLEGPVPIPGVVISETNGGGPMVPPGTYNVKLTVNNKEYSAPLVIQPDPRVKVSQADFDKQYEFAVTLRDRVTELHKAVIAIRAAHVSLEQLKKSDASKEQAIDGIEASMAEIEGQMTQVASVTRWADLVYPIELDARYGDLMNVVESADSAPPAQTYDVFQSYEQQREDSDEPLEISSGANRVSSAANENEAIANGLAQQTRRSCHEVASFGIHRSSRQCDFWV